jgi:hypothetical protein
MLGLIFGMCKSQHAMDVRAQHERRARKKDTKSIKVVHANLNLQPPRSPIASEAEESPKIESFEEQVTRFEVENPVQQWYGDTSFDGFRFGYSGEVDPSYSQLPPFDSPPPVHPQNGYDDNDEEDNV